MLPSREAIWPAASGVESEPGKARYYAPRSQSVGVRISRLAPRTCPALFFAAQVWISCCLSCRQQPNGLMEWSHSAANEVHFACILLSFLWQGYPPAAGYPTAYAKCWHVASWLPDAFGLLLFSFRRKNHVQKMRYSFARPGYSAPASDVCDNLYGRRSLSWCRVKLAKPKQ